MLQNHGLTIFHRISAVKDFNDKIKLYRTILSRPDSAGCWKKRSKEKSAKVKMEFFCKTLSYILAARCEKYGYTGAS